MLGVGCWAGAPLLRTFPADQCPPVWQQLTNWCRYQREPDTSRLRRWRRRPTASVSAGALRFGVLRQFGAVSQA